MNNFGINSKGWNNLKWLDVHALAANLIKPYQSLEDVHYFTSRVRNAPEKEKRQNTYLEALQVYSSVTITGRVNHCPGRTNKES